MRVGKPQSRLALPHQPNLHLEPKVATVTVEGWKRLVSKQSLPRSLVFRWTCFGVKHLRPIAVQQRHLWDSNPRGQSLSSKVSLKHQNQCRSPRFPPSLVVGLRLAMSLHVLANTQHSHHRRYSRYSGLSWTSPVAAPKTGAFLQCAGAGADRTFWDQYPGQVLEETNRN